MNDPQVESLKYMLRVPDQVKFENAPPLHYEMSGYVLDLENDLLTVTMKDHYAAQDDARAAVDFLRAWELDGGLRWGGSRSASSSPRRCSETAPAPGNQRDSALAATSFFVLGPGRCGGVLRL